MIGLAVSFLWLLIGVCVLALVIWLVLYGLKTIAGLAIPARVEQGIWFIFMILVLIYALTTLGSGHSIGFNYR